MIIRWTLTAKSTFFKIISYLEEEWTDREILNFIDELDNFMKHIKNNPYSFPSSRKKKNIRKGFLTKHISLFYKVKPRKREIHLLTFWDNRQTPDKLKY